jgi:hypothetical protein
MELVPVGSLAEIGARLAAGGVGMPPQQCLRDVGARDGWAVLMLIETRRLPEIIIPAADPAAPARRDGGAARCYAGPLAQAAGGNA